MSTLKEKSRRTKSNVSSTSNGWNKKAQGCDSYSNSSENDSVGAASGLVDITDKKVENLLGITNSKLTIFEKTGTNAQRSEEVEDQLLESKINIEEHPLEATNIETKTTLFYNNFITYLNAPCDICDDITAQRVIKLNKQERFAAAIVVKKCLSLGFKPKRILCRQTPEQACGRCFTKIVLFKNRLKKKFLENIIKKETIMESSYTHGCKCLCASCQKIYGQLGLIVTGIESLTPGSAAETVSQGQNITTELENIVEQQSIHIHELQPATDQMFHRSESSLVTRSSELYTHMNTSEPPGCLETFSQDNQRQYSYQLYSNYSTSRNQPFTSRSYLTNPGQTDETQMEFSRYRYNPHNHPSTSSTYNMYQQEETYSYPSMNIGESSSRETSLPTMLQDIEKRCETEFNQPSTSAGFSSQSQSEEELSSGRSKKICSHCQKQFTHTGDYRKHLRKHTKEKPYACKQCDKRFSHTSNLHRHERSHTGDRPYICQFCNKQFNRKDKLDSHQNSKSCKNKRKHVWK